MFAGKLWDLRGRPLRASRYLSAWIRAKLFNFVLKVFVALLFTVPEQVWYLMPKSFMSAKWTFKLSSKMSRLDVVVIYQVLIEVTEP